MNLYNIRIDDLTKIPELASQFVGANYLLLYNKSNVVSSELFSITKEHPSIWPKEKLKDKGYPSPSSEYYLMFSVKKCEHKEFVGRAWDVSKLNGYSPKGYPFVVSFMDLMNTATIKIV